MDGPVAAQSRVVATAGHVDHGKSSLIVALTGMDPDRWDEEKRRGLTIDLGYAWCTLPSGREIAFVDVPGHERFIGNMLAGVGPVRSVLFVVAADEGWKPQSEEHLQILDVLGASSAVVALTKRDLVDEETAAIATEEVRDRLAGTALFDAPIVAGLGIDRRRHRRTPGGARRHARACPAARPRSDAPPHRPGLHDQGRGHGGDRHPHRRLPLGRRRRRPLAVEPSRARPFAPEPPHRARSRVPRVQGGHQPGRHRTRRGRTR